MATTSRTPSTSPSTTNPTSAAIPGSRLMSTPNTWAGRRRNASSSSEYGMAEESIATPAPTSSTSGSSRSEPPSAMPNGSSTALAATIASVRPEPPGNTQAARALNRMYAAQKAPASRARAAPPASVPPPLNGSESSRMPAPAITTNSQSLRSMPVVRGRQMATSTTAASSTRNSTVPPGPTSSNSDLASDAPVCTEATAPSTSTVEGTASAGDLRLALSLIALTLPARDHSGVAATDTASGAATAAAEPLDHAALERLFEELDAPFALVDLDAMWLNAAEMTGRAAGKPIRVARKSVRSRSVLERIMARDEGFRGLMTFTLDETLWLYGNGFRDLLLAYPTADRAALANLARLEGEGRPIVMVDSIDHLELIAAAGPSASEPVRVCIELDVGFHLAGGRVKIGPKRSSIRTPEQAVAIAREIVRRPALELAGLMGYEGHIAGVGDRPLGKPLQRPVIRRAQPEGRVAVEE